MTPASPRPAADADTPPTLDLEAREGELSPLLEPLNPIQREAVLHTEGPVLIVAGAGSGKTRALTHRVAYLIREQGVSPYEILAITFTNKAAREMAERVEGLLGTRVAKGMWILTFHSSCARILRREHNHLGLPSTFSIYDEGDTERVLTLVLKELELDPKRWPPRAMSSAIGKAKDELLSPSQVMERAGNFYDRQVAEVYARYERRLRAAGALDFDDLISETARLFRDHPEVLEHYQERFRYILVDEYQDTNRAQYHLVNLLAAKYRNLCVVGDADQGVYSWRGATIQNLLDFERDYPDAEIFLMEQNYRSTQNILAVANALIRHNVHRKPKNLWTEGPGGELVVRFRADSEHDESGFVAQEIERLHESEGYRYRDVAVFYRTNAQSRVLEDIFMRAGIPYRVVGGVRFYERKEIKDLLAYLRLLVNPQDLVSARRVINTPKRGIGDATVAAIEEFSRWEEIPFIEAARRVDEISVLAARARGAVASFVQVLDRLAAFVEDGMTPSQLVQAVAQESGYLAELEAERTVEAQGRIENIQELSGVAAEFEARGGEGLSNFLEQVALVSDADQYDERDSTVTLMTLHIAKGLEFPVVFIVGMEDGVFPHYRSMTDAAQLEEERRLAYVGITRARERLYLTNAWSRSLFGQLSYNPPSRFLAEIPPELVRQIEPRGGRGRGGGVGGRGGQVSTIRGGRPQVEVVPGDTVVHDRWGEGVVLAVNGLGGDMTATVAFEEVGEKRLMLSFAPLKKL
ncbi:MAG TPA: DNA helicase PcrA [Actinomycetota bacterium]|nr:DNA helicase PcrA [Actinomycetota bacterium]